MPKLGVPPMASAADVAFAEVVEDVRFWCRHRDERRFVLGTATGSVYVVQMLTRLSLRQSRGTSLADCTGVKGWGFEVKSAHSDVYSRRCTLHLLDSFGDEHHILTSVVTNTTEV